MKCFKGGSRVEQIWFGFCGDCWDTLGDELLDDIGKTAL